MQHLQLKITPFDQRIEQKKRILELFEQKNHIFTQEFGNLGIYQYNARIKELRDRGYNIVSCKIDSKFAFKMEEEVCY